jgi:hypothetical protein
VRIWAGYSYDREYDSLRSYMPFSDKHPNLLRVKHVGTGDGFFYYTMPIADDKTRQGIRSRDLRTQDLGRSHAGTGSCAAGQEGD